MDYPFLRSDCEADLNRMSEVMEKLSASKVGRELIEDAKKHETTISFDGSMRAYGSYDEVKNHVRLNPSSSVDRLIGTMAHELRHAQQFQKGILLDAYLDTPKSYIQNQAAIEADASVTATHACYELALQGDQGPLESLREKDAHIVNPFQNAAVNGGLDNGEAHKAGFKGWFTDYSTRDCYDILYIKMYNQRRNSAKMDETAVCLTREVPVEGIVEKVCVNNGKPYLSQKETKEFFDNEDTRTVSFERFNSIYSNLYFKDNLDYKLGADENMKRYGLVSRPHSGYMPAKIVPEALPLPTIENRQAVAAEKIAAAKADKNVKKEEFKPFNPEIWKTKMGLEK